MSHVIPVEKWWLLSLSPSLSLSIFFVLTSKGIVLLHWIWKSNLKRMVLPYEGLDDLVCASHFFPKRNKNTKMFSTVSSLSQQQFLTVKVKYIYWMHFTVYFFPNLCIHEYPDRHRLSIYSHEYRWITFLLWIQPAVYCFSFAVSQFYFT